MRAWAYGAVAALVISACGAPPAMPQAAIGRGLPVINAQATSVIYNFAKVNDHLYRGGQPNDNGLAFLVKQGVRAVVSFQGLPDEQPIAAKEQVTAQRLGLKWVHMPVALDTAPPEEFTKRFFAFVQDPANQPCYVHCRAGKDRTGMMVGLYRMQYEGWTNAKVIEEEKSFGHKMGEFPEHDAYVAQFRPFALPVRR